MSNNFTSSVNSLGYGASFPYMPPLWQPQLAITALDKLYALLGSYSYWSVTLNAFLIGLGTGDSWELFWYNNQSAVGSQLYPTGIYKYYDLFSL